MRIVFLGTPDFAVPVLDALYSGGHEIVAVISQPDREKDKKGNVLQTPIKQYALAHNLPCLQFEKVSDHADALRELYPDVMITAAYGQILRAEVLQIPTLGVLNVHASLLPYYRGSSPVQSAILFGEVKTGVTIMKTDIGMDTGDILSVQEVDILPTDTAADLSQKLSAAGAQLLLQTLPAYAAGKITPIPQNAEKATYCKKIEKADALIDWHLSAQEIACKIRAYNPWPIAYSYLNGMPFKIYAAQASATAGGQAGTVVTDGKTMSVACGSGSLILQVVQIPGKKALPVADFLRGHKIAEGTVLQNA